MTANYRVYTRLLAYTRPYVWRLVIGILCGVLSGGTLIGVLNYSGDLIRPFEAAPPAQSADATVDAAVPDDRNAETPENADGFTNTLVQRLDVEKTRPDGTFTWQFFIISLIGLPIFVAVKSLATYVNRYFMRWVGGQVVVDLRDDLFAKLQNQSLKFYGKCDVGSLISHCTNDTIIIERSIAETIADLTRCPIEIFAALGFIVYTAVSSGFFGILIALLLLFPLIVLPIVIMGRRIKRYTMQALRRISDLVSRMQENFTGIRVVKAFHMEAEELERFKDMNKGYFQEIIRALRAELLMTPLMEFVGVVAVCAGVVFCYTKGIQLHQFGPMVAAAIIAYRPVKKMAKVNVNLQRCMAAGERLFELMDTDTSLPEATAPVPLRDFRDRIVFDHVHFAYDEGSPEVLRDINFELPKGHVVAFVGQTGSGKTTVANLLARFYDPTSGIVTLDGINLRDIATSTLRKMVGVVTQETILFNDTIANNIAYGTKHPTRAQIEEAARQANAHDFIMADPEGYERVVGEKGFVLSGGQRQRVAIARAILKNPPILILDEATSALDTVTERLVQEALARLMEHRTVFAIAHRLSTIKHANQIFVIENGHILEQGTHGELYDRGGIYRELCDMQFS